MRHVSDAISGPGAQAPGPLASASMRSGKRLPRTGGPALRLHARMGQSAASRFTSGNAFCGRRPRLRARQGPGAIAKLDRIHRSQVDLLP